MFLSAIKQQLFVQLEKMEEVFKNRKNPSSSEREELTQKLELSDMQVKIKKM